MSDRQHPERFVPEIEEIKRRVYARYEERLAAADFAEGLKLTCEMNEEVADEIERFLEG
jgi:hypothetical protein